MHKIKIAFLAGCMNYQKGLSENQRYHSVTNDLLLRMGIQTDMSLHSYRSYDSMTCKSVKVLEENNPDIFCLFIRHFPLFPLHKPFIKFEKSNGKTGWAIHPQLVTRKHKWNYKLTEFQSTNDYIFKRKRKVEWRDLNILLGLCFGLDRWAYHYIKSEIEAVRKLCKEQNIKLVVVSPVRNPESVLGDFICRRMALRLERFCKKEGLNYANIANFGLAYFEEDKVHLNAEGHELMGKLIYENIIDHSLSPLLQVAKEATLYSAV